MNNPSVCHPSGSQTPCVRYLRLRANPQTPSTTRTTKRRKKKVTETGLLSTRYADIRHKLLEWHASHFASEKVRSKESKGHLKASGPLVETSSRIIYRLPKKIKNTYIYIYKWIKSNLPASFLTSVPPGVGLFPPLTSTFFCHACRALLRCIGKEWSGWDNGATVCLSRVAAWEWMARRRHRLGSQRDAHMLMGLQAAAASSEEAWCQHQRLAPGSLLAS